MFFLIIYLTILTQSIMIRNHPSKNCIIYNYDFKSKVPSMFVIFMLKGQWLSGFIMRIVRFVCFILQLP